DLDLRNGRVGQYLSSMILDASNERVGECTTPTHGHSESVGLEKSEEYESADPGALLIGGHEILAGDTREMHPYAVVLEPLAQQIMAAHAHDTEKITTLATLVEHRVLGPQRNGRRVQRAGEHGQPRPGLFRYLAIGLRIPR